MNETTAFSVLTAISYAVRDLPTGAREITVSQDPVLRGKLWNAIGARVPFPEGQAYDRCYVALVDPKPTYRWSHGAWWVFVPVMGEHFVDPDDPPVVVATDFPPHEAAGAIVWTSPQTLP